MISEVDENGDGEISLVEFKDIMKKILLIFFICCLNFVKSYQLYFVIKKLNIKI